MNGNLTRYAGTLSSFGTPVADGSKFVVPGVVTLSGSTDGGGTWSTIASDEYYIAHFRGALIQQSADNDSNPVDWSTFNAFKVTYEVCDTGAFTTYTDEAITFADETDSDGNIALFGPLGPDGQMLLQAVIDLVANRLILPAFITTQSQADPATYPPYAILFGDLGLITAHRRGLTFNKILLQVNAFGSGAAAALAIQSNYGGGASLLFNGEDVLTPTLAPVARISSDYTSSDVALSDVTGLSFPIGASEVWEFDVYLAVYQSGTGGIKVAINGPAGATVTVREHGTTADVNTFLFNRNTSLNTAGATFCTASGYDGMLYLHGVIVNSTNAGTVQLRGRRGTANGTARIYANSYMVARKVA